MGQDVIFTSYWSSPSGGPGPWQEESMKLAILKRFRARSVFYPVDTVNKTG